MATRYILIICALLSATASAETVMLAHDGEPAATIVVQKDADELVRAAAEDLRHYVQAICGVELPLRDDGVAVPGVGIYIGECAASKESDLPPEDGNPETYAIRVREGNVFLTGRHPPAIAFATVSFIEDVLGVRWYAPGELWEYMPKGEAGELQVEVSDRVVMPDWSPRIWSGHGWTESWRAWCLRNKAICVPPVPFRNMQNYIHRVFAPEKFAETHPEYYPFIHGKRWIPSEGDRAWRPCESNPDVVRLTVEAAREYLDAHPEHNSFSLAMDDISHLCGCENCRAMDASPDDYKKRRFSDRHYKFVNAVARELAKTHPDKYIGTLCYNIARELPKTVDKLEPNVFISMTQCVAEWWRPGRKEEDMELTRQWRQRCEHMSRYDYMGLGFLTPRVFPHAMTEGMKFDHALGFEGVYNECYTFLPNTAPMMWMIAKLQWDTELDADGLLDEFCERMFGTAAGAMKQYYELLEHSWMTPRPGRLGWGHRNLITQSGAMSVEDVDNAGELLQKAQSETSDANALRRIDIVAAGLRYGGHIIRARGLSQRIRRSRTDTPEEALATIESLRELDRLSEKRQSFWAEAMERDDILGETLRGLSSRKYFEAGQIGAVEAPGSSAMLAALETLRAHSPEQAAAAVDGFAGTASGVLDELARAWLLVTRDELPNRLENADFEKQDPNTTKPEADWETAAAPPGWSTWHNATRDTRFYRAPGKGRSGSTAVGISEAGSACYLQTVGVEPGQRYLCSVWARQEKPGADGAASLGIRWRTPEGAWHERRELEPSVALSESGSDWQLLGLVAAVPEGAGQLVFMLRAGYQEPEAAVLFDDAALYVLPQE